VSTLAREEGKIPYKIFSNKVVKTYPKSPLITGFLNKTNNEFNSTATFHFIRI
jgi:hypothetical protein